MGKTLDISESLYIYFYDHVSYKENIRLGVTSTGGCIGVYKIAGGIMLYYILTKKGTSISRKTVQRPTNLEKDTDKRRDSINEFDIDISRSSKG